MYYSHDQVIKLISLYTGDDEEEIRETIGKWPFCNSPGCNEFAEWEGWDKCSPVMHKICVCNTHKHLLRGYKGE